MHWVGGSFPLTLLFRLLKPTQDFSFPIHAYCRVAMGAIKATNNNSNNNSEVLLLVTQLLDFFDGSCLAKKITVEGEEAKFAYAVIYCVVKLLLLTINQNEIREEKIKIRLFQMCGFFLGWKKTPQKMTLECSELARALDLNVWSEDVLKAIKANLKAGGEEHVACATYLFDFALSKPDDLHYSRENETLATQLLLLLVDEVDPKPAAVGWKYLRLLVDKNLIRNHLDLLLEKAYLGLHARDFDLLRELLHCARLVMSKQEKPEAQQQERFLEKVLECCESLVVLNKEGFNLLVEDFLLVRGGGFGLVRGEGLLPIKFVENRFLRHHIHAVQQSRVEAFKRHVGLVPRTNTRQKRRSSLHSPAVRVLVWG